LRNVNVWCTHDTCFKTIFYFWLIIVNVYFVRLSLSNLRFEIFTEGNGRSGKVLEGRKLKERTRFPPNLAFSINLTSSSRRKEGRTLCGHSARFLARSHSRDTITVPGWTWVSPEGLPGHARSSTTSTWIIRFLFLPLLLRPPRSIVVGLSYWHRLDVYTVCPCTSRSCRHRSKNLPPWNQRMRSPNRKHVDYCSGRRSYTRVLRKVLFRCKAGRTYYC